MKTLPGTYESKLNHDIMREMNVPRGQSVDVGLPGQYVYKPIENVYIAHVASTRPPATKKTSTKQIKQTPTKQTPKQRQRKQG